MHEVAGDEDQRGVAVVCVDVGNRRLKTRIRIDAVERSTERRQVEIGEVDDLGHGKLSGKQYVVKR